MGTIAWICSHPVVVHRRANTINSCEQKGRVYPPVNNRVGYVYCVNPL